MTEVTPLRRNRAFQMLWIGGTVSELGSAATALALPLLILAVTGSPAMAGIAATVQLAASMLVGVPAGVWVDRWDRRRIMIACQALRIGVLAGFGALVFTDLVAFWHILALAGLHGAAGAFFRPAHAASIQAIVPASQLASAYAQEQARSHSATLVGPPLGGLLFTAGRAVPFLVDAVTYLVSLVCVLLARVPRKPPPAPSSSTAPDSTTVASDAAHRSMRADVTEAVRWLWRRPGLRAALAFAAFSNVLVASVLLPVIVLVEERGGGAINTGGVVAGVGIGGLLGAAAAGRISRLIAPGRLLIAVHLIVAVALCAMALPLGSWWPIVPLIVGWFAVPAVNVVISALLGQLVPATMMGRMHSLLEVVVMGFAPAGPVLGGFLAAALGGGGALLVLGVALLAGSALAGMSRALRGLTGSSERGPSPDTPAGVGAVAG